MLKLTFCFAFVLIAISMTTFAGQSGYILNGKVVVTHRDGIPVENLEAADPKLGAQKPSVPNRQPAGLVKMQGILQFDEDDLVRCYWLPKQDTLQCIKK